jgi:SAM-dependent methyltransferase
MPDTAHSDSAAGAAIYSSLVLAVYDAWVLGFSNRHAWQCPTRDVLLPFYGRHLGARHLDVGVGTGYYPAHSDLSRTREIALLDLNPNSLRAAARRIGRPEVRIHQGDVLAPVASLAGQRFDSISLFYLLHCLPGTPETKAAVFANLKGHLAPDGVLYGATILGDAAGHNGIGRALMKTYNAKGVFGNRGDSMEGWRAALGRHFESVELEQRGKVALFTARAPRP